MSLTVTLTSVSNLCFDLQWSSSSAPYSYQPGLTQYIFHLVSVAPPSGSASGCEWTIEVRDPTTSTLRLDLERSGIVGKPVTTVRRCRVMRPTRSLDEQWWVEQVGTLSTVVSAADFLGSTLSRCSIQSKPATTSAGDGFYRLLLYSCCNYTDVQGGPKKEATIKLSKNRTKSY